MELRQSMSVYFGYQNFAKKNTMLQVCSTAEQSRSQYFKPRIITDWTRINPLSREIKYENRWLNTLF